MQMPASDIGHQAPFDTSDRRVVLAWRPGCRYERLPRFASVYAPNWGDSNGD
jgi:hypothetical protein